MRFPFARAVGQKTASKARSDRWVILWRLSGADAPNRLLLGTQFQSLITDIDHWIAFVLLALIGFNMVRESFGESERLDASFRFKTMLPLAIATSIDALAVGVTFAFLQVQIIPAVSFYWRNHVRFLRRRD